MSLLGSSETSVIGARPEGACNIELPEQAAAFGACSIEAERLIWHPSVHRYFGEECRFYFIRFRTTQGGAGQTPIDRVDAWLSQTQIQSRYVYLLFGYYDVLLRVWAPPARMAAIRDRIMRNKEELFHAREFQVTHCQLMLDMSRIVVDDPAEYLKVQTTLEAIQAVATINDRITNSRQGDAIKKLIQSGLLSCVSGSAITSIGTSRPCFRFATVLQLDAGQVSPVNVHQLQDHIVQFNKTTAEDSKIIRCAIYQGTGFGDFLVSGLVSNHETLTKFSDSLIEKLSLWGVRCRTETHVTATARSIELDVIDPFQGDQPPAESRMIEFLSSQQVGADRIAKSLKDMSPEQHQRLVAVYSGNELSLVQSEFAGYFRDFLRARVFADQRYLQQALMCLLELEGLLVQVWRAECDRNAAQEEALALGRQAGLEKFSLKRMTLADVTTVTGKFESSGRDWVRQRLGLDWLRILRELQDTRNAVAHGKLYVEEDYLDKNWDAIAVRIGELGALFKQVRAICSAEKSAAEGASNGPD